MSAPTVASDLLTFVLGASASIGASAILAWRIEHVGGHLGVSEALLGMIAALAADSPEITSSVTAMHSGQHAVGIGVVLGSNMFNLAALLGLGSLAARKIVLHRRVVLLEGAVSLWIAAVTVLLATGVLPPAAALGLCLAVFLPYCALIGARKGALSRLGLPESWRRWLTLAVHEEDLELGPMPKTITSPGFVDIATIGGSLAVVVFASIEMEHAGVDLGHSYRLSSLVVGGLLLAAVTSLPNAVAAIYLARRGRGPAVLSVATNSNALNVLAGLLLPGVIIGLGASTGASLTIAWWYGALTAGALGIAFYARGVNRWAGGLIIAVYAAFVLTIVFR